MKFPPVLVISPLGAVGSLVCMFLVGRRNPSALLMILFTLWVAAPYVAMAWAARRATGWSAAARSGFQGLALILTAVSLAVYGTVAFGPSRSQPAAMFLVIPFVSLLAIAATALICRPRKN